VTGMKIVQLFNREEIEANKFKEINDKHAWIKQFFTTSFFPIADIISSLTLGFIIFYGGIKIPEHNFTTLEFVFVHDVYRDVI
jgi:ABC-type multidrug transport system fused ATPase/permease subunit